MEYSNDQQLLGAILQGQRDASVKVQEVYNLVHDVRREVAGLTPRIDRLERDQRSTDDDNKKIWTKLYQYGFQAAVVAYIVMEQKPWER